MWRAVGDLALPIGLGVAVYVSAHALMRSPELRALRRRWRVTRRAQTQPETAVLASRGGRRRPG